MHLRSLVACVSTAALSGAIHASGDVERHVIFRVGMDAAGFPAGSSVSFSNPGSFRPPVNNRGHVAVTGLVTGPEVPTESNEAIWLASRGGLTLVLREDDPFPAIAGNVRFSSWLILGIGDDDAIVILATLRGDVSGVNDSALCRVRPGAPVEVLARTGDTIDDIPESPVWTHFQRPFGFRAPVNSAGEFAIRAITSDGRSDWYASRDGGLQRLAGANQAVMDAPSGTMAGILSLVGWSDSGIALFYSTLTGGGTTPANDTGVVAATAEGLRLCLREGDPIPEWPSAMVGSFQSPANVAYAADTEFFAFGLIINGPTQAIWTGTIDEPAILVRRSDPVPGMSATFESVFWFEGGPEGNAFCANLNVGGSGAWVERDGEIVTLCRPGLPAPETEPGVFFGNISPLGNDGPLRLARFNRAAFAANLTGSPAGARILYQTDVAGAARRVVRGGDVLPWNDGELGVTTIDQINLSSRGYLAIRVNSSIPAIILARVGCPATGCDAVDFDGDCRVTIEDLSTLLAHFGGAGLDPFGDTDRDHDVDLQDLTNALAAFGSDCRQ